MYKLAGACSYTAMSKFYSTSFMFVIGLSRIESRIVLGIFLSASKRKVSGMRLFVYAFVPFVIIFHFAHQYLGQAQVYLMAQVNGKWLLGCQVFNDQPSFMGFNSFRKTLSISPSFL